MELSWRVSLFTSGLHAAHALAAGQSLVDEKLAAALATPAKELAGELAAISSPPLRLWRHLLPLSAEWPDAKELARLALIKATGAAAPVVHDRLWRCLAAVQQAFQRALQPADCASQPHVGALGPLDELPRSVADGTRSVPATLGGFAPLEELRLRERPLRELFEARGPGLLRQVGELTEPTLIAPAATVLTVHPATGGGGGAHLDYNSVRIEALLANSHADLPEVLRLGWLLAQLQQDLPANSEAIHRDLLPPVAALAMLPPLLAAGERVELNGFDRETCALALAAWRIPTPPAWSADPVSPLLAWWEGYLASRPSWPVALEALARMTTAGAR